ncbi:MAG: metallophosphoesterase [Candidatus Heimdallarchaeota archaeon]|nr:metallophosphoesterase [Candidatus Heimdallarchaeota archaeon]
MRIQILSDLHLEFGPIKLDSVDRDLLILAGDVFVGTKALGFIQEQLEISPVIYVLGNHEFYHHDYDEVWRQWKHISKITEGLSVLENQSIRIDDIEFFGCVLWSDFEDQSISSMNAAQSGMMDYQVIRKDDALLVPIDTLMIHKQSVDWLGNAVTDSNAEKKVVITHHLPSFNSVHPKYHHSTLNGAFYSDLNHFITEAKPNYWIHGHTHEVCDYSIGSTRIRCNPRGYVGYEYTPEFNPHLILEM